MNKLFLFFAILSISICTAGSVHAQKKPLGHDVYDGWRSIAAVQISENGTFVTYEVKSAVGDGKLVIHNTVTGNNREIERGTAARFFGNQKWLTYKVNPTYAESRKAQIDKVAKEKMPKAQTYVLNLATGDTINVSKIDSPVFLEKAPLMVFLKKETPAAKESAPVETSDSTTVADHAKPARDSLPVAAAAKPDVKKPKPVDVLFMVNVEKKDTVMKISYVDKYSMDKDGTKVAYSIKEDSVATVKLWNKGVVKSVFEPGKATVGKIVFDEENSNQFAFTVLPSNTPSKQYTLYNVPLSTLQPRKIDFTEDGMSYSQEKGDTLYYTKKGTILRFNIAPAPPKPEKDTLLPNEKFVLDLWSYTDTLVPSQQIRSQRRFGNSYPAIYNLQDNYGRRLGYGPYISTSFTRTADNARFLLMSDSGPYEGAMAWDQTRYIDYYLFWPKENKKEPALTKIAGGVMASPASRWVVYFDTADRAWYSLDPNTKQKRNLTAGLGVNFHDELYDWPGTAREAGTAGWAKTTIGRNTKEYAVVYDRYDIWLLDPSGKEPARRLTDGRDSKTTFRPLRTNSDAEYVNELSTLILSSENEDTRATGFWSIAVEKNGTMVKKPVKLIEGPYKYTLLAKAKEADKVVWKRENYNEYPDLHTSSQTFANDVKISDANPELKDYLWGSVEIIRWKDKDGKDMQGLLYLPENYDPNQKYPALIYLYEKLTDKLHLFQNPVPSWSIIVPSMYTSNGYAILMPDIDYVIGEPCQSALNAVVSAAEELVRRGIATPDRIGINGQSWGGAQLNYIITQTDAFKCASIGAGVSNMFSGYGNVRGDSGTPRPFMYETGQSRIGGTIWDMPQNYINNSAVFHLPNVNTPVLLRHSDNDEAVDFSQGLEMFNGLRRLGKPVWLLNYNGGGHNLKSWAMRKDFSVRMQQFFDHYLKDEPQPRWMVEGINIKERGKEMKLDLVE